MFEKPTVLIVGAGASFDFGFPIGSKLATEITNGLNLVYDAGQLRSGDAHMAESLRIAFGAAGYSNIVPAARVVSAGLPAFKSIDDFLYSHSDNPEVMLAGKVAVARIIAGCEAMSAVAGLWRGEDLPSALAPFRTTWLQELVQTLVTGVRRSDAIDVFKNLSIVSFNYDRAVESLLYFAIQPALNIDSATAAEALRRLQVFRPYGGLGRLPITGGDSVPYGETSAAEIAKMAGRIQVYTEDLGERPDLVRMTEHLVSAERYVFLGFGFHKQNVKLLSLDEEAMKKGRRIYGSAYGENSDATRRLIQDRLGEAFGRASMPADLGIYPWDCGEYLRRAMPEIAG